MDCVGLTVMHLIGRHQADAGMVMLLIVPIEEAAAERLGILDAAEAPWKLRLVFHGFEVAFRERIVVGGVRPAVRFGDAEIGEQKRRDRRAESPWSWRAWDHHGRHAGSTGRAARDVWRWHR